MGLMRRRYGYYWAKLIGTVLILIAWVVGFIWIGDSWWQLANAGILAVLMTQIAFLGHDSAHRQIFRSGRWNDWVSLIIANLLVGISYGWWQREHNRHHANPNKVGADPDIALTALALTPAQATKQRSQLMRWMVAHQGWYFFPILLLLGLSMHHEAIRRVISPAKIQPSLGRDQLPHPPHRRIRCSGLPRASAGEGGRVPRCAAGRLRPVHGFIICAQPHRHAAGVAQVEAGLPTSAGVDEPQHQRRIADLSLHGRAELPDRTPPLSLDGPPHLRKAQPLVAAYCAAQGVPYTRTTLWQSYRIVIGYLNTVGLRGKDPFLCPLVAQRRAL
jgi:Fatty acid desaturase